MDCGYHNKGYRIRAQPRVTAHDRVIQNQKQRIPCFKFCSIIRVLWAYFWCFKCMYSHTLLSSHDSAIHLWPVHTTFFLLSLHYNNNFSFIRLRSITIEVTIVSFTSFILRIISITHRRRLSKYSHKYLILSHKSPNNFSFLNINQL